MWNVNIKESIKTLQHQIDELEKIRDGKITKGKNYYRCKECGSVQMIVMSDYAKANYCSDCWKKKGEKEKKELWAPLIGATLMDFEIDLDDYSFSQPRLTKLFFEKDGKTTVIEAEEIQHMIL